MSYLKYISGKLGEEKTGFTTSGFWGKVCQTQQSYCNSIFGAPTVPGTVRSFYLYYFSYSVGRFISLMWQLKKQKQREVKKSLAPGILVTEGGRQGVKEGCLTHVSACEQLCQTASSLATRRLRWSPRGAAELQGRNEHLLAGLPSLLWLWKGRSAVRASFTLGAELGLTRGISLDGCLYTERGSNVVLRNPGSGAHCSGWILAPPSFVLSPERIP